MGVVVVGMGIGEGIDWLNERLIAQYIYIYIYTSVAYVAIRRQKYSGPGVLWELAAVLDVLKEYVATGSRFGSP